jgi:hypothetical protein
MKDDPFWRNNLGKCDNRAVCGKKCDSGTPLVGGGVGTGRRLMALTSGVTAGTPPTTKMFRFLCASYGDARHWSL